MGLTTITSREAAQMLTPTSNKWGLSREAQPILSVCRVRNGFECIEDNVRGLT